MKNIGQLIKEERNRKGLSQAKLASLLGVSRTTVAKYETGSHVPDEMLEEICNELRSPRLRLQVKGGAIPCYYLDNVDLTPAVSAQKAIEEMEEAIQCLKELDLINKNSPEDLTDAEKKELNEKVMIELQDVNICVDLLFVIFAERFDSDLTVLNDRFKNKLLNRGYATEVMFFE